MSQIESASDIDEAAAVIESALLARLARTMMVPVEDIDKSKAGFMLGVDSLIAVELRSWFAENFRADVNVFEILQNTSIPALSRHVASQVFA